ncbi:MAG: site-2 protease family protein [Clostridia bacterium]|nr:site-2 protease family protein [Clostridia bacterium]
MIDVSPGFVILIFIYCITGNSEAAAIAYLSALIHELSHICTAKLFRYTLNKVSVLPCGFSASFKGFDKPPFSHEIIVALSGPAVNLVIAFVAAFLPFGFNTVVTVAKINIYMLVINLLPVYPLDGGRVVYAFLKNEMQIKRAYKIMHYISLVVTFAILILGVICIFSFKGRISLFIAALYMISNISLKNAEISNNETVSSVKKLKVFSCLQNSRVSEIILKTGVSRNTLIFVKDGGRILGCVTEDDLRKAAMENRYDDDVMSIMKENTDGGF